MSKEDRPRDPHEDPAIDPSIWRGLSQPRLSRRDLLRYAGLGAGAFGLAAFLEACGVKGQSAAQPTAGGPSASVSPGAVGSADWWSKQTPHNVCNFANWPYYLDVYKGKHPTLEKLTEDTGIKVTYTEPINDNIPFYTKIRPSLQ